MILESTASFFLIDENGFKHSFENAVTFGFNSKGELSRLDEEIEKRICRLELKDHEILIRDLKGGPNLILNENRIIEAFAKDRDIFKVANKIFQIGLNAETRPTKLRSKNPNWNARLNSLPDISKSDFPVLLLGPSGTGKEGLAEEIHALSPRKAQPFIRFNCSALTETLAESELFGHVKGSFTGALNDRRGLFEAARGGTLFLDEIGDLPYSLQAKLLRALENQEIRPVGSDKTIKTDVRIVAATHQNLSEKIFKNSFRADLYYRLNVIQLPVPSLTQRPEDIEGLIFEFARNYRVRFSISAIQALRAHPWPGNIRELKNLVARASVLFPRKEISLLELDQLIEAPPKRQSSSLALLLHNQYGSSQSNQSHRPENSSSFDELGESRSQVPLPPIKRIEKQMILERLEANRGNQRQTALDLGIPKSTLHDRLKAYKIDPKNFMSITS
jgi:DNA-binding NtrC family response regulator